MKSFLKTGFVTGIFVGIIALTTSSVLAARCLSYLITHPAGYSLWYCEPPVYPNISFPINMLTDDLSRAGWFAPTVPIFYAIFGAIIGWMWQRFSK